MIDVVYLAYFNEKIGYGLNIVEQFLKSYRQFSAGMEHNLVIVTKNCKNKEIYDQLSLMATDCNAKLIDVPDDGYDIGSFIRASKVLGREFVFFLGSNIELLSNNWLSYIYEAFEKDEKIQLVGPMGAHAQGKSDVYPNPHIRTCAFMIKRELFVEYASGQKYPETKEDTWRMEHCANSLSNFVVNKGYKIAVVNSDGEIFKPEDWSYSHTYVSPTEDSKLLMEDKWVKKYKQSDFASKIRTEIHEWGRNLTKYPENFVNKISSKVNIFIPYFDFIDVFSSEIFHPIFYGIINEKFNTEAFQDNNGINIASKHPLYGELTAFYWIWKNLLSELDSEYVGFCQWCRFLDFNINSTNINPFMPIFVNNFKKIFESYTKDNIFDCINGFDVILPGKTFFSRTVYEQYLLNYQKEDFDLGLNAIKEIYPEYSSAVDEVMSSDSMYLFGNFVMKKELLNEFMTWLFSVLESIEEKIDENYSKDKIDIVLSKFITERFFNIWLVHNVKTKDLKTKSTSSYMIYFNMQDYLKKSLEKIQQIKNQIKG